MSGDETAAEARLAGALAVQPASGLGPYSSPELGAIAAALAKAQGAFKPIARTREVSVLMKSGGRYTFKYAPLDEVIEATRPALTANGLAVVQLLVGEKLSTTLLHSSGQWIASTIPLGERVGTLQELGSKLTYLRRYTYASLLGVAPEEDDDGHGGNGGADDPPRQAPRERAPEAAPQALDEVRTKAPRGKAAPAAAPQAAPKPNGVTTGRTEYLREVLVDNAEAGQSPTGAAVWSVTVSRDSGDQMVLVTFDEAVATAAASLVGAFADVALARKTKGDKSWLALERIQAHAQDEGSDASRAVARGEVPF